MTRRACEGVAKEEIAESRGEEGGTLERRVLSVKEARRRGRVRDVARGKTLSGAILVIATRVLLHSPLNNAVLRAHVRDMHARQCACESEHLVVSKDPNGVEIPYPRKDRPRGRFNYSRDA